MSQVVFFFVALPAFFFCSCSPECDIAGLFTVPTTASATLINISKTFFFFFFFATAYLLFGAGANTNNGKKGNANINISVDMVP